MHFIHDGNLHAQLCPSERFAGRVWQTVAIPGRGDRGLRASRFVYEPGARSAWHTHDSEQALFVLAGSGLVAAWEEPVARVIGPGDWVHVPAHQKHWHGSGPETDLVHLAINSDGGARWLEHVTDDQYWRATQLPEGNSSPTLVAPHARASPIMP